MVTKATQAVQKRGLPGGARPAEAYRQALVAIAGRIREARDIRGLTAIETAHVALLSRAAVWMIETRAVASAEKARGPRSGLSVETLLRIADALRVRPAWLLTGEEPMDSDSAA